MTEISLVVSKSFDLLKFKDSLDIRNLEIQLNELTTDLLDKCFENNIREYLNNLAESLIKLETILKRIDDIGKSLNYDIKWIYNGKLELGTIFTCIHSVDHNINFFLTKFENFSSISTEILDLFNNICDLELQIKKYTHPFQKRLSVTIHYNEINQDMLSSVNKEVISSIEKLDEIDEKQEAIHAKEQIMRFNMEEIKNTFQKMNNMGSVAKYFGFIILSQEDVQIYDTYTTLYDRIVPISQSIKYIPLALDDLFNNSRIFYPELVMECMSKYEKVTRLYDQYRQNLKTFKQKYLYDRVQILAKRLFDLIHCDHVTTELAEDVIRILKPLEQSYGLEAKYSIQLKDLGKFLKTKTQTENCVPLSAKDRSFSGSKRIFSNPLTTSLNLVPILSNATNKEKDNFKIFHTPRHIDDTIYSNENKAIIDKIKIEVYNSAKKARMLESPIIHSSPESNDSSPGNIFDSPNPFITPSGKSFQRYKMGNSTPASTPRITPTKKYVMLPVDETPGYKNYSKRNTQSIPLLRYEHSTVIKVENIEDDPDVSNISDLSIESCDISAISDDIPVTLTVNKKRTKSNHNSSLDSENLMKRNISRIPTSGISRIPLPTRPESRLDLLRSTVRVEQRKSVEPIKPTVHISRPESRLESLASSISAKLGTESPVSSTRPECYNLKPRSVTVLSHREMMPKTRQIQLGRMNDTKINSNNANIKYRGVTSLGYRNIIAKSRISSV